MNQPSNEEEKKNHGYSLMDFLRRREASRKEKIERSRAHVAALQKRDHRRKLKLEEAIVRDREAELNSISTDSSVVGGLIITYVLT